MRSGDLARLRAGIVLAALLTYLLGIWWGLPEATSAPMIRGWDVDGIAGVGVLSELHNLLVQPKADWYTAYPLLHYAILSVAYAPYLAWLVVSGGLTSPGGSYPFGLADPVTALAILAIIARSVTLVMAVGSVLLVFEIGRRLAGEWGGVTSAILYLLSGPAVYYSRTSNLDVPVQFWTLLGVLLALQALEAGLTPRRAAWLGVVAALAVGTKDQAYGAWIGGLVFVAVTHLRTAAPADRWRPLLLLTATGLTVFLLCNGVPFRPERLVLHLRYLTGFEASFFNLQHPAFLTVLREPSVAGYVQLAGDAGRAVLEAVGAPTVVLGLAGLWLARRVAGMRLILWMLAGLALLVLVPIRHMQYRYTMLPAFVLCVGAGAAVGGALRAGGAGRRRLVGSAAVFAAAWSATKAIDLTWQMLHDARYAAGAQIAASARPGDKVGYYGAVHQMPHLPAGVTPLQLEPVSGAADLRREAVRFLIVAPDFFSDPLRERSTFLPEETYRALLDGSLGYRLVQTFRTEPLLPRLLPYFPYVNPTVRLFERVP